MSGLKKAAAQFANDTCSSWGDVIRIIEEKEAYAGLGPVVVDVCESAFLAGAAYAMRRMAGRLDDGNLVVAARRSRKAWRHKR